jgi:hypothetical protein
VHRRLRAHGRRCGQTQGFGNHVIGDTAALKHTYGCRPIGITDAFHRIPNELVCLSDVITVAVGEIGS